MIYFSATTGGFYPQEWKEEYLATGSWPDDALLLTKKEQTKYWKHVPATGKMLGVMKGRPVWLDIPPLPAPHGDTLAALARRYRDAFIKTTDSITVIDYSIDDSPLTDTQRAELTATRAAYRAWPTVENWPQVELPELPQWLLIEAVNQGYCIPNWPPLSA